MRSSIGSTWLLQLMVIFIFLFAGFIILTINYSKTVKVKNELVNIVEKYEGINDTSVQVLNNYLYASGYIATGVCNQDGSSGVYGAASLTDRTLEPAAAKKKYYYCVKKFKGLKGTSYYQISVFYKFNLPFLGAMSGFVVKGTTSNFKASDSSSYGSAVS